MGKAKTFADLAKGVQQEDLLKATVLELVGSLYAKQLRQDISQTEWAEKSGVAQKTISDIINGKEVPKLPTLVKLADGLGYTLTLKLKET